MDAKKTDILGLPVDCIDFNCVLDHIKYAIDKRELINIITLNAEMTMLALEDKELADIILNSSLVIPDGVGVIWALRRKNVNVQRLAGIDLVNALFPHIQENKYKLYFLGADSSVVSTAAKNVQRQYPSLDITGDHHGYFHTEEDENVANIIKEATPDILLVALGVPKQEKWIAKWQKFINVPVCIGVGGTFDVLAGRVKRAPSIIRRCNMEWLYRLYKEPWRLNRMQVLPKFVQAVMKEKN